MDDRERQLREWFANEFSTPLPDKAARAEIGYLLGLLDQLRTGCAYEANVLHAQTDGWKAAGKGRSEIFARQIKRLRDGAEGKYAYYGVSQLSLLRARADLDRRMSEPPPESNHP